MPDALREARPLAAQAGDPAATVEGELGNVDDSSGAVGKTLERARRSRRSA